MLVRQPVDLQFLQMACHPGPCLLSHQEGCLHLWHMEDSVHLRHLPMECHPDTHPICSSHHRRRLLQVVIIMEGLRRLIISSNKSPCFAFTSIEFNMLAY